MDIPGRIQNVIFLSMFVFKLIISLLFDVSIYVSWFCCFILPIVVFDLTLFATELGKVLSKNRKLMDPFKPIVMEDANYVSSIVSLFESSKLNGPKWTGASKEDCVDFRAIQHTFEKCLKLEMFPPQSITCFGVLVSRACTTLVSLSNPTILDMSMTALPNLRSSNIIW